MVSDIQKGSIGLSRFYLIMLTVLTGLFLGACSSGGDSTTSNPTPAPTTPTTVSLTGVVVDGYLDGAIAFLDLNGNGSLDAGEPWATTGANGRFALVVTEEQAASGAAIVVDIPATAVDQDTGQAVGTAFVMSAPAGHHGVISPISTLIKEQMDQDAGLTVLGAEENVKFKIGLSGSTVDLLADYVAAAQNSADPYAAEYARVHNIARVSAEAVKNNLAAIKNAAANTDATVEDLIGVIVERILAELSNIALQVDLVPTNNFDPYAALGNTGVATIPTNTIAADVANVQAAAQTPVITLNGSNQITIVQGTTYLDAGAVADSNVYGDISSRIVVNGTVDTNVAATYTLTYDVSDAANNAAAQVLRVVTVAAALDTTAPVLTLIGTANINWNTGTLYVAPNPGVTSDDPYASITVTGYVDSAVSGTYTLTYSSVDGSGNIATPVVRTINMNDVTPPAVFVLNGAANVSVLVGTGYTEEGVTAWDAVDGDISANVVVTSVPVLNTAVVGIYVLTYNISDAAGNAALPPLTRTVNVALDAIPPVVTAPPTLTVEATAPLMAPNLGIATAVDNLDGNLVPVATPTAPYTIGTHTITWTAIDSAGNVGTATQTLNIVDTTAPSITAPVNVTMEATGNLTAVAVIGSPVVSDPIAPPTVTHNIPAAGFPVGVTTITWTATDAFNNSATATQTVTITDTTPPTITLNGVSPVTISVGSLYADLGATVTDIVDSTVALNSSYTVNTAVVGTYTFTYNATDAAGNSATPAIRTVNVVAGIAPDPIIALVTNGNSVSSFSSFRDMQDQMGVYRQFHFWTTTVDVNGNPIDTNKNWDSTTASFIPAINWVDQSLVLTAAAGWQVMIDSYSTLVDDTYGNVLITESTGHTITMSTTVIDVSGQNVQTALVNNLPLGIGEGTGRWATAVDPRAVFSANAKYVNGTDTTNEGKYTLDVWDDGTGCLATGGNCNAVSYWDHVANFNALPADVVPTQLNQMFSIVGDTNPYNPALQLYKDIFTFTEHSVSMMAVSTLATTGELRIYANDTINNLYGAYDWTGVAGPIERAPVALGTWNIVMVNGQQFLEYVIPPAMVIPAWMQGVTKGVYAVQSGFVRLGAFIPAGAVTPWWVINDVAMADVEANFSKFTYVYDPAAGGGVNYMWGTSSYSNLSGIDGQADVWFDINYDAVSGLWVAGAPLIGDGRYVLDATGANTGFNWLTFDADGLNMYNTNGTIDFSMGGVGFGHDARIGVTIDDVRGQLIADYVDPFLALSFLDPYATFSDPGPGASAPVVYYQSFRSIGDRYKINNQAMMPVFTSITQLIGTNQGGCLINGVATDVAGTASCQGSGVLAGLFFPTTWDIRTVHGVQMLYIDTSVLLTAASHDKVGIFFAQIGATVSNRGDHLTSAFVGGVTTGADTGFYNMDTPVTFNQTFNAVAITDIKVAIGQP